MTKSTSATKTVPVTSPWTSKINWAQILAFASTGAVGLIGVLNLDAMTTAKVTASVAMAGQVITFVLRTWFTASVLTPSVTK
jgi:hypothetical protein